jgi:hypothetical protein
MGVRVTQNNLNTCEGVDGRVTHPAVPQYPTLRQLPGVGVSQCILLHMSSVTGRSLL